VGGGKLHSSIEKDQAMWEIEVRYRGEGTGLLKRKKNEREVAFTNGVNAEKKS